MFRTTNKDNSANTVIIQGARSKNTSNDIASILYQNYDADTSNTYTMASINMMDAFGNSACNGYGVLSFRTNQTGTTNLSNLNEVFRINEKGYLGIGTSQPQTKLHVDGVATFSSNLNLPNNLSLIVSSNDGVLNTFHPLTGLVKLATNTLYLENSTVLLNATTSSTLSTKLTLNTSNAIPPGIYRADICYQLYGNSATTKPLRVTSYIDNSNVFWHDASYLVDISSGFSGSGAHSAFNIMSFSNTSNHTFGIQYSSLDGGLVGLGTTKMAFYKIG